jgi:hypothetical protein
MKPRHTARCPCCKGERYLYVFEPGPPPKIPREPARVECTHCQATGEIEIEVPS